VDIGAAAGQMSVAKCAEKGVRLGLIWTGILFLELVQAVPPPPGFDNKGLTELIPMLDSGDAFVRKNAAAGIGWHLGREKFVLTNVEPALVGASFSKIRQLLRKDDDPLVRLAAVAVLFELDAWTNAAPALAEACSDSNKLVRVRAIGTLLIVSERRHSDISSNVLSGLQDCLDPNVEPEILWQAALVAGQSGCKWFLPSLYSLSRNSNPKVRRYVEEAIAKLKVQVPSKRGRPLGEKGL
jgi:HEAT repeat protein